MEADQDYKTLEFEVIQKQMIFLRLEKSLNPVITTIEKMVDPTSYDATKIIKTLRIYHPETLQEIECILLEELDVKKHKIKNYDIRCSFTQNKSIIYFFRRMKSVYKLHRYDFRGE